MTQGIRRTAAANTAAIVILCFSLLVIHLPGSAALAAGAFEPDRIILNLTETPATSMAVTWRTAGKIKDPKAQIAVALASPALDEKAWTVDAVTESVTLETGKTVSAHSVVFQSLQPETVYVYRVGGNDVWSEWNQFRTASAASKPFRFLYFGDPQNDILSKCSRVFREAYRRAPDAAFWQFVGDIVNNGENDSEWGEFYGAVGWAPRATPFMLLPGNHEYKKNPAPLAGGNGGEQKGLSRYWRPQFTFPLNGPEGLEESAYYFDYQGVRFIMLNGTEKIEEQARWIKKVLSNNPQRWTIVGIHQPFYSTGQDRDNIYHQKLFTPLFDKYGVDLVLQGHDHTYGRTHKVRNGKKQDINARGTVYVVTVTGPKQYKPSALYEKLMARTGTQTQLYQVISVDTNKLTYESYTVTGEPFDSFVLEKK